MLFPHKVWWWRMDISSPLSSIAVFDSLLCPSTSSLSSAIFRHLFWSPSHVCFLFYKSSLSQQDEVLQPSHLLQERVSFPLAVWSLLSCLWIWAYEINIGLITSGTKLLVLVLPEEFWPDCRALRWIKIMAGGCRITSFWNFLLSLMHNL